MRLPNESQLSPEQKEVCYAPTDETILVIGPPGSGKTVIAVFRKNALQQQDEEAKTLVYNQVLSSYTGVDQTFMGWLSGWWRNCTRGRFPAMEGGRPYEYDYEQARLLVRAKHRDSIAKYGHWGHLIIDEAQDFGRDAHELLAEVQEFCFEEGSKPNITILADENQRLTESNSTFSQIKQAYLLGQDQIYQLERNYRNTREIAALAASYYVGLASGIPKSPSRRGDVPRLYVTEDLDEAVGRIVNYARLNANEDIGVLVHFKSTRRRLFNKLQDRLGGTGIVVQGYESGVRDSRQQARNLRFDNGGSVTVLCHASAKGLEFDTVFLPELQELRPADHGSEVTKMTLYVMISRARDRVFMSISDPLEDTSIWQLLRPAISERTLSLG